MTDNRQNPLEQTASPSDNYEEAKGTLVYRLSELMFGSILASYIFGFISFAASILFLRSSNPIPSSYVPFDDSIWLVVADVVVYIFISGTYAYTTAAMYMRYHIGILTMPTAAIERSRLDLTIAISQVLLFGISMLIPPAFFLCVAITLAVTALRQNHEVRVLTKYFTDRIWPLVWENEQVGHSNVRTYEQSQKNVSRQVKLILKESEIKGWRPVTTRIIVGCIALGLIGLYSLALPVEWVPSWLKLPSELLPLIYSGASCALCICVVISAHITLQEGARFMYDDKEKDALNNKYKDLKNSLQTIYKSPSDNNQSS